MKKVLISVLSFILGLVLLVPAQMFAEEETKHEIIVTSGELYDSLMEINPELSIMDFEGYLNLSMDLPDTNDISVIKPKALTMMRNIADVLNTSLVWDQFEMLSFTNNLNGDYFTVRITDYIDPYRFTASFSCSSDADETTVEAFTTTYYMLFGGHDMEMSMVKQLSDILQTDEDISSIYQNGYLWAFSTFPNICDVTSIDGLFTVYSNTFNASLGGKLAWRELGDGVEELTKYYLVDPDAMPYFMISIVFVAVDTGEELLKCDLLRTEENAYEVINMDTFGNDEFKEGVQSMIDAESGN